MVSQLLLSLELKFVIGFLFCFIAGFMIGYERGSHAKPAGVRTHTIVCMGAMLFTLISDVVDPLSTSRIAANIIMGIGFVGAGMIIHHKGSIYGVTTAATIWMAAAIGMAIGFGLYLVSFIATLLTFVILKMPHIGEHGPPKMGYSGGKEKTKKKK